MDYGFPCGTLVLNPEKWLGRYCYSNGWNIVTLLPIFLNVLLREKNVPGWRQAGTVEVRGQTHKLVLGSSLHLFTDNLIDEVRIYSSISLLTTARNIRCRSCHATACLSTASLATSNTPEESWFRRGSPVTKCSFLKIAVCCSRRTSVHSELLEARTDFSIQCNGIFWRDECYWKQSQHHDR